MKIRTNTEIKRIIPFVVALLLLVTSETLFGDNHINTYKPIQTNRFTAEYAEIYTAHYYNNNRKDSIRFKMETKHNYTLPNPNFYPYRYEVKVVEKIIDSLHFVNMQNDTLFCIRYTDPVFVSYCPAYILKNSKDTLAVVFKYEYEHCILSYNIMSLKDYIESNYYTDFLRQSAKLFFRIIFSFNHKSIESMVANSSITYDAYHINAMRFIIKDGKIRELVDYSFNDNMSWVE